jgi:dTDP-4-dehydrorhamnose reductase
MKLLLIGDQGQVGREITELAAEKKYQAIGFDVNNLDITNQDQVFEAIKQHKACDVLINAAAYTAVDKAEDEAEKAYAVNRDGVANLAQACCEFTIPLLHISTDYVFSGEKETAAYTEEDQPNPLSVYGKSKLAGEEVLSTILPQHIILRISWVFGKYGHNFVKTILKLADEREILSIVGDQRGCPTPAADVARVLLAMALQITQGHKNFGVYHYCGQPVTTWFEFAKRIIEFGKTKHQFKLKDLRKITTAEYPTKAVRPKNSELAVQKIIRDYGVERRGWADYLKSLIKNIEI